MGSGQTTTDLQRVKTPLELKEKYNLTWTEIAFALGITEQQARSYSFRKSSPRHCTPPRMACILSNVLDKLWQIEGKSFPTLGGKGHG